MNMYNVTYVVTSSQGTELKTDTSVMSEAALIEFMFQANLENDVHTDMTTANAMIQMVNLRKGETVTKEIMNGAKLDVSVTLVVEDS